MPRAIIILPFATTPGRSRLNPTMLWPIITAGLLINPLIIMTGPLTITHRRSNLIQHLLSRLRTVGLPITQGRLWPGHQRLYAGDRAQPEVCQGIYRPGGGLSAQRRTMIGPSATIHRRSCSIAVRRGIYQSGLAYHAKGDDGRAVEDLKKACGLGYYPACKLLGQ